MGELSSPEAKKREQQPRRGKRRKTGRKVEKEIALLLGLLGDSCKGNKGEEKKVPTTQCAHERERKASTEKWVGKKKLETTEEKRHAFVELRWHHVSCRGGGRQGRREARFENSQVLDEFLDEKGPAECGGIWQEQERKRGKEGSLM